MNKQAKRVLLPAGVGTAAIAAVLLGYFATPFAAGHNQQSGESDAPPFKIIERNMVLDTAVISVETSALGSYDIKRIARYLTEQHVQDSRDAAAIYFYKTNANLAKDEPAHKIAWKRRSGYELEY